MDLRLGPLRGAGRAVGKRLGRAALALPPPLVVDLPAAEESLVAGVAAAGLKLRQQSVDMEHQPPGLGGGVDPLLDEVEIDLLPLEPLPAEDQVLDLAEGPVETGEDDVIAGLEQLEVGGDPRALRLFAQTGVLVPVAGATDIAEGGRPPGGSGRGLRFSAAADCSSSWSEISVRCRVGRIEPGGSTGSGALALPGGVCPVFVGGYCRGFGAKPRSFSPIEPEVSAIAEPQAADHPQVPHLRIDLPLPVPEPVGHWGFQLKAIGGDARRVACGHDPDVGRQHQVAHALLGDHAQQGRLDRRRARGQHVDEDDLAG